MSDRLFKGSAAVLLIAAGLWLTVRALRAPSAAPGPEGTQVQALTPIETLKGAPIEEGERGASSIPPLKLTREKKTLRRTEPLVPPPSPNR